MRADIVAVSQSVCLAREVWTVTSLYRTDFGDPDQLLVLNFNRRGATRVSGKV